MKSSLVSLLLVLGCVTTASAFSFTKHKDFTKVKTVEKLGDIGLLKVKYLFSIKHHICLKPSQDIIDAADNKDFSFILYYADKKSNEFWGSGVRGTPWDEKMACGEVYTGSEILYDFEHNLFNLYNLQLSRITWKKGMEPKMSDADKEKAMEEKYENPQWDDDWLHKQDLEQDLVKYVYQL
ncbi:hypothetical protein ACQY0O_004166 [Thecaphora frezii]